MKAGWANLYNDYSDALCIECMCRFTFVMITCVRGMSRKCGYATFLNSLTLFRLPPEARKSEQSFSMVAKVLLGSVLFGVSFSWLCCISHQRQQWRPVWRIFCFEVRNDRKSIRHHAHDVYLGVTPIKDWNAQQGGVSSVCLIAITCSYTFSASDS